MRIRQVAIAVIAIIAGEREPSWRMPVRAALDRRFGIWCGR
jgi:hypothetical protein